MSMRKLIKIPQNISRKAAQQTAAGIRWHLVLIFLAVKEWALLIFSGTRTLAGLVSMSDLNLGVNPQTPSAAGMRGMMYRHRMASYNVLFLSAFLFFFAYGRQENTYPLRSRRSGPATQERKSGVKKTDFTIWYQ